MPLSGHIGYVHPHPAPLRVPVLGALLALVWLTVAVLPSTRPNQGSGAYFGAALIAVVAGAAIVMAVGQLRVRARLEDARVAEAVAPILALAIGSVVLGGLAYALKDASPTLQDAFTWAAQLGALATLVSVVPLPGSDGARAIRLILARTRTPENVQDTMAKTVKGAGIFVIIVGLALAGTVDIGLGILAVALGWITLASSRVTRAKHTVDTSLADVSVADVTQLATPIPGWRSLADVVKETEGGWPLGLNAVPVVDWSGNAAGVLSTVAAERALAAGRGDERVSALAVPGALVPSVADDAPAASLVQLLAGTAASVAVVTHDGHPIGTVSGIDLKNAMRTTKLRETARTGA